MLLIQPNHHICEIGLNEKNLKARDLGSKTFPFCRYVPIIRLYKYFRQYKKDAQETLDINGWRHESYHQ